MPSPVRATDRSSLAWRLRQALFWVHLAVGLCVAAIVIVMSATGVLLTYQKQLTLWADTRGLDAAPPAGVTAPLPADSLLARVTAAVPGTPTAITWRAGRDAPVQVAFGRERAVFASAYTGEVLGEGSKAMRGFFATVTEWHRWLARSGESRAWGKGITGAANIGFLFLVLSGAVLWWPRNLTWRAVRGVLWFRRRLSPKA
ncbi:MAG TPA: PepSY-associated TM helix domain-containing protein, partial [Gemmatimonadaceae bacterium]